MLREKPIYFSANQPEHHGKGMWRSRFYPTLHQQRTNHDEDVGPHTDESHEPRVETRGMTTRRTPTRPGCLHHSAEHPGIALIKHIRRVLMVDLRGQMVVSRA